MRWHGRVERIFSAIERTYRLSLKPGNEGRPRLTLPDRFSRARYPLFVSKPLKLSSWKTYHRESPQRYPAISGLHRAGGVSIRRVDVSCQISEKVVASCPAGGTASRNTLQSCKGRWDLRGIPQRRRLPVIQVHILDDSLSRINATLPAGDVSLPTCSATLSIPR